jgi:hypothetical protein
MFKALLLLFVVGLFSLVIGAFAIKVLAMALGLPWP